MHHFFNNSITHPIGPYGMLAPFYDDLDDNNGAEPLDVYSHQDTDNNRFIIQWNNIANGQHDEDCILGDDGSCPKETFQLILSPNGEILFQYKEVNDIDENSAHQINCKYYSVDEISKLSTDQDSFNIFHSNVVFWIIA